MENKATFAIKITDLETGEVLLDRDDMVALIGGITFADGDVVGIGHISTNPLRVAMTLDAAEKSIEEIKRKSPLAAVVFDYLKSYKDNKEEL